MNWLDAHHGFREFPHKNRFPLLLWLLIIIFNSKFLGNLLSDLTARRTKLTTNGNYCVHM